VCRHPNVKNTLRKSTRFDRLKADALIGKDGFETAYESSPATGSEPGPAVREVVPDTFTK